MELIILTLLFVALIYWLNHHSNYFRRFNLPFVKSFPILGSFFNLNGLYENIRLLYNHPDVKGKPVFGVFFFHKPGLMISDPELIKRITVKDFSQFTDRYASSDVHDKHGNYGLFGCNNPVWKIMRSKMSPFFSSGKMKMMYYLIDKASSDMTKHIDVRLDKSGKVELEMKNLASLYSTDTIASCVFGVEAKSLENPKGEFRTAGHSVFNMSLYRTIEFGSFFLLPQIMKLFGFKTFSAEASKFINDLVPDVINERKKSGTKRHDLIDTFVELENNDNISQDALIAQAAMFLAAGFETSSATQSFALYEMAKKPEIQDRLRDEIKQRIKKTEGKVTYDCIMNASEMPYLNQVFHETLRLYAILPAIDRVCTNPDGYSLEPVSDFKVPFGMPVYIPYFAMQRDEKFFPDPMKFDPERFASDSLNLQPFTNFPFGSGPRNCIGERFGIMQTKAGIVKILKDFRLEVTENTPKEIVFEERAMIVQSKKGLFLNLVKDPLY